MIKKLQLKFIMINMSIVTLMLCVILGMVYQFTKGNLESENLRMMQNIASHPLRPGIPDEPGEDIRLPYFMLQVGVSGELVATGGGYYDLSNDEFLEELIRTLALTSDNYGVIEEYNLRYLRTATPLNQCLVFTDISSEIKTLKNLMKNCLIVGIVSFLIFLIISIMLAKWAVKPVDAAWRQQRQFVADASHELKTPLTIIMTNAELMQNSDFDEESRAKFSQTILGMSRQMRGLLEQMLVLARADNSQPETELESVDLSKLVSDAILPFEPVFFEKDLTLKAEIDENIMVKGVGTQLKQMVDIFLDNAQKYSSDGGTTWVMLEKCRKGRCLLKVANEGEMIPEDDLKNIFKRFYRADKARERNGSFGIGLSIAERTVAQHHGKIWAESKGGKNTFYVELPCT